MTKFEKVMFIGAELRGLDVHANYERTSELRSELLRLGMSFVGVSNISNGKKCQLFLVTTTDENAVLDLARKFGQKAVLVSDENRNTEVVSTKSNGRTNLGKLSQVSKEKALKSKFCLLVNEDNRDFYFVAK